MLKDPEPLASQLAKPTDPDLSGELNRVNQVQDDEKGAFETAPFLFVCILQ
jgi:hypothetical protein